MPCDSISTVNVDLTSAKMDIGLLEKALVSLGQSVTRQGNTLSFSSGYYDGTERQMTLNARGYNRLTEAEVKRAYGAEVVKSQAARYGWTLRQVAPYKFEVIKR